MNIIVPRISESMAEALVSQVMAPKERVIFERMHQAGIQFTPEQFSSLFLGGGRTGRTSLIALRMLKEALSLKKGETRVFVVKDHREFMRNHMDLRRIFISLLKGLEVFRIRRKKNVVTVTAL